MKRYVNWLLSEAAKKKAKKMPSAASLNTPLADINEILLGYYALGATWTGFVGAAEAKRQLDARKTKVGEDLYAMQSARAKVMAVDSLKWAKAHGYKGKVKKVWWTARPGILSKAVGYEVDSRKNPTDTLLLFGKIQFLGISAKSTAGKGDIGFKNPGVGTVDRSLKINLKAIADKHNKKFGAAYGLSDSNTTRKKEIRGQPRLVNASNVARDATLKAIRLALYKKLDSMTQSKLRAYLLDDWMDVGAGILPPYIKVTGHGKKPPFTSTILDPLANSKASAVGSSKITLEKVGNDSVGILAGGHRIMKMRAKYESQAMASTIKFSGDPWK